MARSRATSGAVAGGMRVLGCAVAVSCGATLAHAADTVTYRLTYPQPGSPHVDVTVSWPGGLPSPGAFVMPRAIPMGYGEQRFDDFVADLRVVAAGTTTAAERVEGPRWRLPAGATSVRYRVDLRRMEHDVRAASDASRVRDGYVGVLGYSVFGYVDGFEDRPISVTVGGPRDWPVFSTLSPRWPVTAEPVDASATGFYALADSQIVMGPRAVFRRLAERPVPVFLASYAEGDVDLDRVGRLVTTAVDRVAGG